MQTSGRYKRIGIFSACAWTTCFLCYSATKVDRDNYSTERYSYTFWYNNMFHSDHLYRTFYTNIVFFVTCSSRAYVWSGHFSEWSDFDQQAKYSFSQLHIVVFSFVACSWWLKWSIYSNGVYQKVARCVCHYFSLFYTPEANNLSSLSSQMSDIDILLIL